MSFLKKLFQIRKRNEGLRLMYADDAESVSSDLTYYEDTQSSEEEGQEENRKEEKPNRRTDFLNELFF